MTLTDYEISQIRKVAEKHGGEIRVAFYARKSQKDTSENSIDTQIAALTGFLEQIRKDLRLVVKFDKDKDIYAEDNRSGTDAESREEFMRMISTTTGDKNKGYYTAVLVFKQDRFARNTNDSVFYRGLLLSNDCFLLSMDVRDNGDAISQLMLTMIGGFNQYYADNNAFLVVNGMTNLARKGKCISSLPYGLKADANKEIYIDEDQASVVKLMFSLADNNSSIKDIYDYLKGNGITRDDGSEFPMSTIQGMLRNEKYIGTYVWSDTGRKSKRNPNRKRVYRKDIPEVRIENRFEAIIDKDQFDRVQTKLDISKMSHSKSISGDGYLLYGLVYCADCGTKMYGSSHVGGKNHVKKRYYECPARAKHKKECNTKNINANYLEHLAMELVYNVVVDLFNKRKSDIIAISKKKITQLENKVIRYKSEIEEHNKSIKSLIDFQLSDPALAYMYRDKLIETKSAIDELNQKLLTATNEYNNAVKSIEDSINLKTIDKEKLFKDKHTSKMLINMIIERIELGNESIKFILKNKNC